MTFDELQHTLNKSVIYFGVGLSLGYCIANYCLLRHAMFLHSQLAFYALCI